MINQRTFLEKYNLAEKDYKSTGLSWKELEDIYKHFLKNKESYEPTAKNISDRLIKVNKVHSVRYRVKDPEHLIAKIIRRKIDDPDCSINFENYATEMTDIVGVRALHLFKSDWEEIHDFIHDTWDLYKTPVANIRKGDTEEYIKSFREKGCEIREHKYNYRSVHYLIKSNPTKHLNISEVQVRTIFEEGWSEIDHNIRYPYDLNNPVVNEFLMIFNRLAGGADEMGSYIKYLKQELKKREEEYSGKISEQEKIILELKEKIGKLEIKKEEKAELGKNLDTILQLANQNSEFMVNEDSFMPVIPKIKKGN